MFRFLFTLLVGGLTVAAGAGCAGSGSSPPTKSADSVSAPNVSSVGLSENFSEDAVGGPAAGWSVASGTWSICQNGTAHAYCQTSSTTAASFNGAIGWTDYTIDAQIYDPAVSSSAVGVIGRAANTTNFYFFDLKAGPDGSTPYWYLLKMNGATAATLASGPLNAPDGNPNYGLRLTFSGSQITALIAFDGGTNFQVVGTASDSSYAAGQIGLRTWGTGSARFGSVIVTLPGSALPPESAVSSDAFVDSIGMNVQFEQPNYWLNMPAVNSLIGNLGVRHYRIDSAQILASSGYLSKAANLNMSYGITFDVLSDLSITSAQVVQALSELPAGSIDSVEGPNESDSPSQGAAYDPNFARDIPAYMQSLYPAVKAAPAASQAIVLGPSFASSTSYAAIGNIANYVDAGNMHDYFQGFNPGTLGWGGSGYPFAPSLNYGSIAWNLAAAAQATGSKPVWATETGYFTAPIHSGVPFDVQAKYVPRLYLEQYRNHVPRTFMFQLVGYDTTSAGGTLDIVSSLYVPSPAYNALAGMTSLLSDGRVKSSPVTYNWSMTGQAANVDHLLMHKANGTLILALWIEVPSFDPNANGGLGAEIAVPQQNVTVNFAQVTGSAVVWTCTPATGAWSSKAATMTNGSVTLNVGDSVSILEIAPL